MWKNVHGSHVRKDGKRNSRKNIRYRTSTTEVSTGLSLLRGRRCGTGCGTSGPRTRSMKRHYSCKTESVTPHPHEAFQTSSRHMARQFQTLQSRRCRGLGRHKREISGKCGIRSRETVSPVEILGSERYGTPLADAHRNRSLMLSRCAFRSQFWNLVLPHGRRDWSRFFKV